MAVAISILAGSILFGALLAAPAGAGIVAKDGKVYACYRAKGKAKGAVRLVAKRQKCRRGEKKIGWSATGKTGESGERGSNGEGGEPGSTGETGAPNLETRVTTLTNRVETLEDKLKGVTNLDLTGAVAKLNGISPTQLQQAVAAVADANALCAQAATLTTQLNSLGGALGGLSVNSALALLGGALNIPAVPAALPAFACP